MHSPFFTSAARGAVAGLLSACVLGLVVACGDNDDDAPVPVISTHGATLFGAQEVADVQTPATGFATLTVDETNRFISGSVTTMGIVGSAAHIHSGAAGVNGPVIVPLTESPAGSGVWVVAADATLTEAQLAELRAGGLYFNVHSAANPGGEIRGQIGRDVRAASLSGAQEVPANASAATGRGFVSIEPTSRALSATLTTTGIVGTMAHIHHAAAGSNGPIVVTLAESPAASGNWSGSATLTEAQYDALQAGDYYFNVHSAALPGGEIRGQIGPVVGAASLTGAQEVPPNASTATGSGVAVVDPVTLSIAAGLKSALAANAAHVHEAAPGVNGPIIVPLVAASAGRWSAASGAVLTPGSFTSMKAGNLYFNAHTAAYPGGEIRGAVVLQ